MGKHIINQTNLNKTIRYLRKNGIRHAYYAARERLEEAKNNNYRYIEPDRETLRKQREASAKLPYRFSIVVPAYETKETYLREMMDSVMKQSYDNWELLIADASKSGRVRAIIKEYSKHLRHNAAQSEGRQSIRYLHLPGNLGISENTNAGIREAGGDYIGLLDHDDLLAPDALYEMARHIKTAVIENRDIEYFPVLLYSDEDKYENGDEDKNSECYNSGSDGTGSVYMEPNRKKEFNLDLILSNNYICHFLVVRSKEMKELLLRKEYDGAQDYDLVLRIVGKLWDNSLNNGTCANEPGSYILHVPRVLYHWRCHAESTAQNTGSKEYAYEAGRRALEDFGRRRGWRIKVTHGLHLGFYQVSYLPDIFAVRPEVGMIGGRILDRHNKIVSGIYDESEEKLYVGLHREYSGGSTHTASMVQDCAAVDIRCLRLRKELQMLFEELLGFPYVEKGKWRTADVSFLSCDEEGYRKLSLTLGEEIRRKGYLVLWDPGITEKLPIKYNLNLIKRGD